MKRYSPLTTSSVPSSTGGMRSHSSYEMSLIGAVATDWFLWTQSSSLGWPSHDDRIPPREPIAPHLAVLPQRARAREDANNSWQFARSLTRRASISSCSDNSTRSYDAQPRHQTTDVPASFGRNVV